MGISEIELLQSYAGEIGIDLKPSDAGRMLRHLDLVLEKNRELNLTAITERDKALILHIIDSLSLSPLLAEACGSEGRFLDLGTGGGYPGIPLAIATGLHGTLLDSVAKKIAACQGFIEELELGNQLEAVSQRAEELAKERGGQYQAVVARAVAPIAVLVEYASPLLKVGGSLIISKAPLQEEEYEQGKAAAVLCGMENVSRETIELPESMGARELLIYIKSREALVELPRRAGMASKRPLGTAK